MKKIIIIMLFALPLAGVAQNVKTAAIQWNSQRTFDVSLGSSTDESTSFTTNGTTSFSWKNSDGSTRKNFQVIEAIGDWTNAASEGRIQFEVTDGTSSGTVTIQRKNADTKVLIVLASDPPQLHELSIQSIQQL